MQPSTEFEQLRDPIIWLTVCDHSKPSKVGACSNHTILRLRKWRSSKNFAYFGIANGTAVAISVQIISHLLGLLQLKVICKSVPSSRYSHLSKPLYRCRNKALFQSICRLAFVQAELTSPYISNILPFYVTQVQIRSKVYMRVDFTYLLSSIFSIMCH
jgi:hypothetical protein